MKSYINSILHYGYYPTCGRAGLPQVIIDSANSHTITGNYDSLVSRAAKAIRGAVDNELQEVNNQGPHVVPLSSGLDSRALLAVLLDHPEVAKSDIRTISFGMPGTWDYEIGQTVAEVAGVENVTLSLSEECFDWSLDALQQFAKKIDHPIRLFGAYVNSKVASVVDRGIIWSGFMGEATAGDHLPPTLQNDWDSVCSSFAVDQQYTIGLTSSGFDPRATLPSEPYLCKNTLSYEDQLDFALRQQCFISPAVIHSNNYRTPFMQAKWLRFILNVPNRFRMGRQLFVDAVTKEFPELFALPTDANAGLPLTVSEPRRLLRKFKLKLNYKLFELFCADYIPPSTNYVDFDSVFRRQSQLKDTAGQLLNDLSVRNCADWLSPNEVWQKHQNGVDRSREIRVLASLELFLKTR